MNRFAFKCPKCGAIEYSNTLRRAYMTCPKCMVRMVRSAKMTDEQKLAERYVNRIPIFAYILNKVLDKLQEVSE